MGCGQDVQLVVRGSHPGLGSVFPSQFGLVGLDATNTKVRTSEPNHIVVSLSHLSDRKLTIFYMTSMAEE